MRYYKQDTDSQLDAVVDIGHKRFWDLGSIGNAISSTVNNVGGAILKAGHDVGSTVSKAVGDVAKEFGRHPAEYTAALLLAYYSPEIIASMSDSEVAAKSTEVIGEQATSGLTPEAYQAATNSAAIKTAANSTIAQDGAKKLATDAAAKGMTTSQYIQAGLAVGSLGLQYAGYKAQQDALNKASDATANASNNAIAENRRQYDLTRQDQLAQYNQSRNDLAPWRQAGREGLQQQKGYLGQMANLPGYDFQFTANSNTEYPTGSPQQNQIPQQANPQDGLMHAGGSGNFDESTGQYNTPANPQGQAGQQPTAQGQPVNQNTGGGLYEDPGYLFRRQEGQRSLNNSMIGRQLGSRAMRESQRYGQGFGSQEYGQAYNRALNRYNTKYNARYSRLADLSSRWAGRAGVGQSAVNTGVASGQNTANAIGSAGQNLANNVSNIGIQQGQNNANLAMAGGKNYSSFLGNMGNTLNQGYSAYLKNQQFNTTADQNQQYLNNMGKA